MLGEHRARSVSTSRSASPPEVVAVDPRGTGDISDKIVWRTKDGGSTMPTAVASNGSVYSVSSNGIMTVLNSKTGQKKSQTRVGGNFSSSPLLAGENLYVGNKEGQLTVFEISGDQQARPRVVAKNQLDGDIMASPAVIGSDLLIRTSKSLLRVSP